MLIFGTDDDERNAQILHGGTGFLLNLQIDGKNCTVLVSNKHVLCGRKEIRFSIRYPERTDPQTPNLYQLKAMPVTFNCADKFVIEHPDSNIDLAILPMNRIFRELLQKGIQAVHYALPEKAILPEANWASLSTVSSDAVMLGYPAAINDQSTYLPIVFRGSFAFDPILNYRGKPQFLLNIDGVGGSSGSPIFLKPNLAGELEAMDSSLLGVYFASEVKTYSFGSEKQYKIEVPLHLGYGIKAYKILDFKPLIEERAHSAAGGLWSAENLADESLLPEQ